MPSPGPLARRAPRSPGFRRGSRCDRAGFQALLALNSLCADNTRVAHGASLDVFRIGSTLPIETLGNDQMPYITTKDGIEIFYKDWGTVSLSFSATAGRFQHDDWERRCFSSSSRLSRHCP